APWVVQPPVPFRKHKGADPQLRDYNRFRSADEGSSLLHFLYCRRIPKYPPAARGSPPTLQCYPDEQSNASLETIQLPPNPALPHPRCPPSPRLPVELTHPPPPATTGVPRRANMSIPSWLRPPPFRLAPQKL